MKAISLWQPWASLMVIGAKRIETRHWPTYWRGPLVIHAAKRFGREEQFLCTREPFITALTKAGIQNHDDLPLGALLGVVDLIGCVKIPEGTPCQGKLFGEGVVVSGVKLPPDGDDLSYGNYTPGRYAWVTEHARRFAVPIPYKGSQGFFDVPAELVNAQDIARAGAPMTETPQK